VCDDHVGSYILCTRDIFVIFILVQMCTDDPTRDAVMAHSTNTGLCEMGVDPDCETSELENCKAAAKLIRVKTQHGIPYYAVSDCISVLTHQNLLRVRETVRSNVMDTFCFRGCTKLAFSGDEPKEYGVTTIEFYSLACALELHDPMKPELYPKGSMTGPAGELIVMAFGETDEKLLREIHDDRESNRLPLMGELFSVRLSLSPFQSFAVPAVEEAEEQQDEQQPDYAGQIAALRERMSEQQQDYAGQISTLQEKLRRLELDIDACVNATADVLQVELCKAQAEHNRVIACKMIQAINGLGR
jgi:hypothetical protein